MSKAADEREESRRINVLCEIQGRKGADWWHTLFVRCQLSHGTL